MPFYFCLFPIPRSQSVSSHDESLLDDMLTHNHDDIRGLISISEFVNIPHIPDDFQIDDISDTIDSITYNCSIPKLPCRITESLNGILVNACDTHMHVVVPKTRDTEMKYFFKDYKNYYYLPMEHMAIHKSMAAYVDDTGDGSDASRATDIISQFHSRYSGRRFLVSVG